MTLSFAEPVGNQFHAHEAIEDLLNRDTRHIKLIKARVGPLTFPFKFFER